MDHPALIIILGGANVILAFGLLAVILAGLAR
jgi:hypothetical protein